MRYYLSPENKIVQITRFNRNNFTVWRRVNDDVTEYWTINRKELNEYKLIKLICKLEKL